MAECLFLYIYGVAVNVRSELEESEVSISSDSAYDSVAHDLVKTRLWGLEGWQKDKPITMHVPMLCDWFSSSISACDSDNVIFT